MDPDDTHPDDLATASTIPAPAPPVEMYDSIEQDLVTSVFLRDPHALRLDWDGFASEALDDEP
jgi:hypothetical protein